MRPYATYREMSFIKGMNDTVPSEHLQRGYLADALNCFIRTDQIVKRHGYTIIGDDLGSNACQALKGVRFADGTKRIYGVFNGEVKSWTGSGGWTNLGGSLDTSIYVEIVVANNAAYFFDGIHTVVKVDSANTLSTVAAMPIGTGAAWFHNMLFIYGIPGAGNDVRISNLGDPENHTTGTATTISVNPNDGDYITGFGDLNDELIVFKSQRVWSITGFGTTTLTVTDLNLKVSGNGTIAPRSIVSTGNELYYINHVGDVPHIRKLSRTRFNTIVDGGIVSKDIETTMSGLNSSAIGKTAGIFDGRNLWFAVPNGSSVFNNKVIMLDTITGGWVRHSGINASCFDLFTIGSEPEMYFGEASADSKAYVFNTSTSDNGSAIEFQVVSRRYGGEYPEFKKKWKYFYVTAQESGDYDVNISYATDGFSFNSLATLNLAGTGAIFGSIILGSSRLGSTDIKQERYSLPKIVRRYIQFKLNETSTDSSVAIRDWEVMMFPKSYRES